MWVEIICGLVVYKLFRRYLGFDDDDDLLDVDSSYSDVCFSVASRLEKLYGGKCFVGLRIPDPDIGSHQNIDLVLVTKREIMVVAVRNFSGFVEADKNGNWTCTHDNKHKPETFPDPVLGVCTQVASLQSYLEQRGASLPKGHITGRVILPNPNCRLSHSLSLQMEVISYEKWRGLKPDVKSGISKWIRDALPGAKNEMQESLHQNLYFILSTSPMWDRLELKGERNVLGEFIEFKGKQSDLNSLKNLKRSKVNRFIIQKSTLFGGFGRSKIQILYSMRDYRLEGASSSEWKDISVNSHTEIMFRPLQSKKPRKFKLSSVVSLSLSA